MTVTPPLDCAVTPNDPACQPGSTTIQDIQGSGFLSLVAAASVERVRRDRHGGPVDGQQPGLLDPAAEPRTSAVPRPRPGSSSSPARPPSRCPPSVTPSSSPGRVSEFYPGRRTGHDGQHLHHRDHPHARDQASARATSFAPALVITPTTVPGTYVPPLPAGVTNVESITTVDPEPLDPGVLGGPRGHARHGQQRPCRRAGPAGVRRDLRDHQAGRAEDAARRHLHPQLRRDAHGAAADPPVNGQVPAANVGDVLGGATTGPVDWSRFGGYAVAATTLGTWSTTTFRPTTADRAGRRPAGRRDLQRREPRPRRPAGQVRPTGRRAS